MSKTYQDAARKLPADACLSCTFGYPGQGGYSEYWRTPDQVRWVIRNGEYDLHPSMFDWTCENIGRV